MNKVHQILNSNSKPNLNSNKGEEKKNRKRKSLSQPKQPTGLDSPSWLRWPTHSRSRPAHELAQAQQASQRAAHAHAPPHLPLLPLPHGPCMLATRQPQCRLPPPTAHASDQAPTALAGAGQGVTPRAWPCLLGATPTQPLAAVGCKLAPPITLDPHPPITSHPPVELGVRL